jgi:hypothetical protein
MTIAVGGVTYLSAQEAATAAGISKPTLLRWIKAKQVKDAARRDRNGWRLFAPSEVDAIRAYAQTPR